MQVERLAVAGQGSCGTPGAILSARRKHKIFLRRCQVSRKNIGNIKLEVIRTGVLLQFSDTFFKMAKKTKGRILVDIIKKMSQHSFFELFR